MNSEKKIIVFLFIISIFLFFPFLGEVHLFDWDEINFAESAREMIVSKDYAKVTINYQPFHEKPPLFIWMQVLSMKLFGINEFAARFPNALIGIISFFIILLIGKKEHNNKFAIIWIITYLGSLLPFFYFKSGIIDPTFNLFIFASVYVFYKHLQSNALRCFINSTILISLAVLTKGPVGLLLMFLTALIFIIVLKKYNKIYKLILLSIISIIPYLIWYYIAFGDSPELLQKFIEYHLKLLTTGDAGHSGPFYFHFLVVLFGAFPASFFAIGTIKKFDKYDKYSLVILSIILTFVVLIVFGIVKTKILHYSSLAYFPITYLASIYIYKKIETQNKINKFLKLFIIIYGIILSLALILFPIVMMNIQDNLHLIKDNFTKLILQTPVNWTGFEVISGIILLCGIIAFIFKKDMEKKIFILFFSVSLTIFTFMYLTASKIEQYTQATPIEFYKEHSKEDAIIRVLGFKSYANYFYGEVRKNNYNTTPTKELLELNIDKDIYVVIKQNKFEKYKDLSLEFLYEKNGFIFLKKSKK